MIAEYADYCEVKVWLVYEEDQLPMALTRKELEVTFEEMWSSDRQHHTFSVILICSRMGF
jgi:hypothetical protein